MRRVVVFFVFLLMLSAVQAFEIETTEDDSIYANETATYTFVVKNPDDEPVSLDIVLSLDPKWSFETTPLSYLSGFTVQAFENLTFELHVIPISPLLASGKYLISVPIRSETEEQVVDIVLYIKNPNALTDYLPSLNFVLDAQEQIDPRQTQHVRLDILNRNPLDIPEMQISLTSALYNETKTASIEPLGFTTVEFDITYGSQQSPGEDIIVLTVTVGDKTFTPIRKQVEIIAYSEIVEVQYPTKSFFFKTTQTTEYKNKGNSDIVHEITYPTTGFQRYFVSANYDGQIIEEQGLLYYKTDVLLPIGVPITVEYYVSYRPIIYLLLLFAIATGCYYYFRSPLTIKKEVVTLQIAKDGRTKLKILLHIKNRSMHMVDDVEIIDKIPAVAETDKHFEIGTVKPEKVLKHEKAGTILQWFISHFEVYEERIITYKVNSMYQIVGDFTLPSALLRFRNKRQQLVRIRSNAVKVGKKPENE